jgi:hypothetical protein
MCLKPSELKELFPVNPKFLLQSVLELGVELLRTTRTFDSWRTSDLRLQKALGHSYQESVGGTILAKIIAEEFG